MSSYPIDDCRLELASPVGAVDTFHCARKVKQRVARNFSRAANSYDDAAFLQKHVAMRTMLGLPKRGDVKTVLDMGSGTGTYSVVLAERYSSAQVTGLDLSMGMLQFSQQQHASINRIHWCSGDIESLPFISDSVDLIFSNLAIQWCSLEQVLYEAFRVLRSGGQFVFSTLVNGSLEELNTSWSRVGESGRVNKLSEFTELQKIINNSMLHQKTLSLKAEVVYYPDVPTILKALKALGVNTVLNGTPRLFTRRKLNAFKSAYETLRMPAGLPLTYQVVYGVLWK
ncbi:MAG: malonyl-ACP O-methyltransferase BioC [Endozoicomonas sp.]